jgi:hypothetical protein
VTSIERGAQTAPTRIAAELEIRRVLAAYCHHCDDARFAELLGLFAPDGCFVRGTMKVAGHAALREYFESRQGRPEQRGRHLTLNTEIDIDADQARALSDFVYLKFVDGRITPIIAGRYRDDLVRMQDGRWRFARREVEDWSPPT